jgi:hypothetical protein
MSKFIKVPAPITLTNSLGMVFVDGNSKPLVSSFKSFVQERIMDPAFSAGKQGFAAALLQNEAIESTKSIPEPGEVWELKSYEQWNALVTSIREPKKEFDTQFAFCLVPFMQAVIEASDVNPSAN